MRILAARFGAHDPEGLSRWYEDNVGAAPTFEAGETTPHHFAFHVGDLALWNQRLDVTDEYDFSSWGGARAVYFRDPEENVVELISRPQARLELTLAEVGLPVDDVAAAVSALQELGLDTYGEWDDSFAPLGDDDGLLIVVREGRNWFPFEAPAGVAPIVVTIDGGRAGEITLAGARHRVISM